ncbi:MAG: hypothetical protein BWY28_02194 [bacterium ADurb.Bin236]|nr:MAG: hypothetical protein BWY28_02194 [bacterium ADurb.Bin236]
MMNELEEAKQQMQGKIDRIAEPGAVVVVDLGGSDFVRILVDRFEILFARPVFGADGAVAAHCYWAVCFEVGFDMGGPQHVRIFKMENIREERPDLFLFRDQRGYDCFIESVDVIDEDRKADFKRWREYKAKNKEAFERLYGEFTEEAMEMALNHEKDVS